jgi:hypothetical protein
MRPTSLAVILLSLLIAAQSTEGHAAMLITHYKFEGNTTNSVGGSPNGTIVGGSSGIGSGRIGTGSLSLAQNEYMTTTTSGHPNTSGLFSGTVAFWIKTAPNLADSQLPNRQFLGNLNNTGDSTAILIGTNGVGNLQLFLRAAQVSPTQQIQLRLAPGGNVLTLDRRWADGDWHHLAFTWQAGATGGAFNGDIYVDGVALQTNKTGFTFDTGDTINPWDHPMVIGGRNNRGTVDQFLPGGMMLDDFRVYNMPLTQSEIERLFLIPEPASFLILLGGVFLLASLRPRQK